MLVGKVLLSLSLSPKKRVVEYTSNKLCLKCGKGCPLPRPPPKKKNCHSEVMRERGHSSFSFCPHGAATTSFLPLLIRSFSD